MNYSQTVSWLYEQLPMFQRVGAPAFKKDLTKTRQLMQYLRHPEHRFKSIHIAGTNGKGSVAHGLAAVFQEAGYKTGLYTSPHLKDFRERMRINGRMIPEQEVVDFVAMHRDKLTDIGLSFFEMTVGMAFDYFAREQVEMAIVETGMGGRFDSTNVVTPQLSIITNISMDHAQFLGDTLPLIAGEKAGIIKPGVPVLIGEYQEETAPVFAAKARECQASMHYAYEIVEEEPPEEERQAIAYRKINRRTVRAALHLLPKQYELTLPNLEQTLARAHQLTGLRGRWETLSHNPRIIADTGHNIAAVALLTAQLKRETYRHLHVIWGTVNDKDITSILKFLPPEATYYWCKPDVPRGKNATELKAAAKPLGLNGAVYSSVKEALQKAMAAAAAEDFIFVGGSTFVVAEVL